jgi:autotransporter passenger strand-loop-strand repeat protein
MLVCKTLNQAVSPSPQRLVTVASKMTAVSQAVPLTPAVQISFPANRLARRSAGGGYEEVLFNGVAISTTLIDGGNQDAYSGGVTSAVVIRTCGEQDV